MRVGRPSAHRQHVFLHVDVPEACVLEQAFEQRSRAWFLPLRSKAVDEFEVELSAGMIVSKGPVRGFPMQIQVNELGIAARCGISTHSTRPSVATRRKLDIGNAVLIALTHQPGPVPDGPSHEATMNIVERLMVRPIGLRIVHLETHVGRYPIGSLSCLAATADSLSLTSVAEWGSGHYPGPTTATHVSGCSTPTRINRWSRRRLYTSASGYLSPVPSRMLN